MSQCVVDSVRSFVALEILIASTHRRKSQDVWSKWASNWTSMFQEWKHSESWCYFFEFAWKKERFLKSRTVLWSALYQFISPSITLTNGQLFLENFGELY